MSPQDISANKAMSEASSSSGASSSIGAPSIGQKYTRIRTGDLYKNKYSIDELKYNFNNLNHKLILATQILNANFCVKYLYDPNIDSGSEDSYLFDKSYILERQPHITSEEFDIEYKKYY